MISLTSESSRALSSPGRNGFRCSSPLAPLIFGLLSSLSNRSVRLAGSTVSGRRGAAQATATRHRADRSLDSSRARRSFAGGGDQHFAVLSSLPRRVDLDVIGPARLQHLLEPVEAIRWPGPERHKTRTRYLPQSGPKRREHGLSHRRFPLCRFVRQDKRGSQSVREPSWDRWQCTGPLPRSGDLPPSPCSRCPESASGPFSPRRPARSPDAETLGRAQR